MAPFVTAKRILKVATVVASIVVSFALLPTISAQAADDASESLALVNAARAQSGLKALARQSGLDSIAAAQAARMADRDAIFHNPNLKSDADAAGVNWTLIGENVGVGADVGAVHDAFMASPGHRDNVLYTSYTSIGVGTALAKDGSVFVAHAFAQVAASAPAAAAPAPIVHEAPAAAPAVTAPQQVVPDVAAPTSAPPAVEKAPASWPNALVDGIVTATSL